MSARCLPLLQQWPWEPQDVLCTLPSSSSTNSEQQAAGRANAEHQQPNNCRTSLYTTSLPSAFNFLPLSVLLDPTSPYPILF